MKYKFALFVVLFMLASAGSISVLAQSGETASAAAGYAIALEQSRSALMAAEAKIQVWSTTDILLADAEVAAEAGDYVLATSLAEEAGLQVELALATAEREKTAWRRGVPK